MPEVCPVALQQTGGDIRGAIAWGAPNQEGGGLEGPPTGWAEPGNGSCSLPAAEDWPNDKSSSRLASGSH